MKIVEFLKQYDNGKGYSDFVLCYTENYSLILLPYIYGLPGGVFINKNEKNWKVCHSSGSSSNGKKLKHHMEYVGKFSFDDKQYLGKGNVFVDNDKCLLDIGIRHEFGNALHLSCNEVSNEVSNGKDVELFPDNRYLSNLYEFWINDYKYYFALTRDQFNHNLLMFHYFSIEKEFKIEILANDCETFRTYRDGGTMEISFNIPQRIITILTDKGYNEKVGKKLFKAYLKDITSETMFETVFTFETWIENQETDSNVDDILREE